MAEDCLKKCIGKLDLTEFLAVYPHIAPSVNLTSGRALFEGENLDFLFRPFSYKASYPLPIYLPFDLTLSEWNGYDKCFGLVPEKREWTLQKEVLVKACKSFHSKGQLPAIGKHQVLKVPLCVARLADHLQRDPDPLFSGHYNWYHSGSNIGILKVGREKFLARPNINHTGNLILSSLLQKDNFESKVSYNLTTATNEEALQISSINANFGVRHRNLCSFITILEENIDYGLKIQAHQISGNLHPFICIDLNKSKLGEFTTISTGKEIYVWKEISTTPIASSCFADHCNTNTSDEWGSVHYDTEETIVKCDRESIAVLDLRVGLSKIQSTWLVENCCELCEEICGAACGNNDSQYILTNHQLLELDLRKGFSQRWTHSLTNAPSIIKVVEGNVSDLIIVGSQNGGEIIMFESNKNDPEISPSQVMPYMLPTLKEALHAARCGGFCLSNIMPVRFFSSLTGLCVSCESDIDIFISTSCGDVFKQTLQKNGWSDKVMDFSQEQFRILKNWEQKCINMFNARKSKCIVTNVVDGSDIIDENTNTDCFLPANQVSGELPGRATWRISKKEILTYCDYLAPKLLDVWDIFNDEEWDSNSLTDIERDVLEDEDDDEYDFIDKVENWIKSHGVSNQEQDEEDQLES